MEKLTQHKVGVVYDEYGNVIKTMIVKDNEDVDIINKKKQLSETQLKYLNNKTEKSEFDKKLGGYIHMAYVKNELLFNKLDLDRANISRLIYLATYLDYNTNNEGLLVKYGQFKEIKPLTRQDIRDMLKLSDRTFKYFLSDVRDNNLLFIKDGNIILNTEYFNKGECNFNSSEYTRIYINTTRELYENSSIRNHKQLSYIFQLIPKLHHETNILLHNPIVTHIEQDNKMSLRDVCIFLGLSCEGGNPRKLLKELLKFYVVCDGMKMYFFKYVTIEGYKCKSDYFIVNPQVIWSGKDMDMAKSIINRLFFI